MNRLPPERSRDAEKGLDFLRTQRSQERIEGESLWLLVRWAMYRDKDGTLSDKDIAMILSGRKNLFL